MKGGRKKRRKGGKEEGERSERGEQRVERRVVVYDCTYYVPLLFHEVSLQLFSGVHKFIIV